MICATPLLKTSPSQMQNCLSRRVVLTGDPPRIPHSHIPLTTNCLSWRVVLTGDPPRIPHSHIPLTTNCLSRRVVLTAVRRII